MVDSVSKHNYYTSTPRTRILKDLRPYSPSVYYETKDHKNIYFDGKYHKAMYLGNQMLWRRVTIAYHYGIKRNTQGSGLYLGYFFKKKENGTWSVYSPEVLYNDSSKNCDAAGVFCVIEDYSLDYISATQENFTVLWRYGAIEFIRKDDSGNNVNYVNYVTGVTNCVIGPNDHSVHNNPIIKECKIETSQIDYPKSKIQFYLYMSKADKTTYLAKLPTGNVAPELSLHTGGGTYESYYDGGSYGSYVEYGHCENSIEVFTNGFYGYNKLDFDYTPFVTDFGWEMKHHRLSYGVTWDLTEDVPIPEFYCDYEQYLPSDILTYLLKDTEIFNDKEDAK